jgi:hypothetical protein
VVDWRRPCAHRCRSCPGTAKTALRCRQHCRTDFCTASFGACTMFRAPLRSTGLSRMGVFGRWKEMVSRHLAGASAAEMRRSSARTTNPVGTRPASFRPGAAPSPSRGGRRSEVAPPDKTLFFFHPPRPSCLHTARALAGPSSGMIHQSPPHWGAAGAASPSYHLGPGPAEDGGGHATAPRAGKRRGSLTRARKLQLR